MDQIQQSTSTDQEELLQSEQKRASDMMRHSVEQARGQEQGGRQLTRELKQQLLAAESERVSKDECAQLHHHTSGMALRKCRQLGQQKLEIKAQQAALKLQTVKVKHAGMRDAARRTGQEGGT